jgi:sulfur relay (sulfurtransferase) DsrF/TusC family protein
MFGETMNHNIVCIKRSSSGNEQYEDLDLVMALASLDYHIHLVFYGDGVSALFDTNSEST